MKISTGTLASFLIILFFCPVLLFCQSFEKSVLINIPGDNYDFDLLADDFYPGGGSFITWINRKDSVYTVYVKRISPEISDSNFVISSGTLVKSHPRVALNRYSQGIKVVWQNFSDNFYRIAICGFINDSVGTSHIIQDSMTADPQISLSIHRVAWIMDNKLYVKEFYPDTSDAILVDSSDCSSPDIIKGDNIQGTAIIYERAVNVNHRIYLAELYDYPNPHWTYEMLADGENRNPDFGVNGGISFETIESGVSRIRYSEGYGSIMNITGNTECNYKNPDVFSYGVPTNTLLDNTPFFAAFDTDSLENNNEVFIKTFYYGICDSLINISEMEGDDYEPETGYLSTTDSVYAVIVWLHNNGSKTDIWMARTFYNPIGSVQDENTNLSSFKLMQNYPNPFNPVTNIGYHLENGADVEVNVFDVLGNQIKTLVNGYRNAGNHKVIFNGDNSASGIYFYSIEVNGIRKTKSMVLLK